MKGGTASAKIPTYHPTRLHLPFPFKINSSFLFNPQYCGMWVSADSLTSTRKPPTLSVFSEIKRIWLEVGTCAEMGKLYDVFFSLPVVQLFMICHIPTLRNFWVCKFTWKLFQHLLMNIAIWQELTIC